MKIRLYIFAVIGAIVLPKASNAQSCYQFEIMEYSRTFQNLMFESLMSPELNHVCQNLIEMIRIQNEVISMQRACGNLSGASSARALARLTQQRFDQRCR